MSSRATAQRTPAPANQLALFECGGDRAAEKRPGEMGRRRLPDDPGRSPGNATATAEPTPIPQPPRAWPASPRADPGGAPALTPCLAEILAAMVDAVLDAEDALRATRGTVAIRRARAPRYPRPAAKRDAREVQP